MTTHPPRAGVVRARPLAVLAAVIALAAGSLTAVTPAQAITWGPKLCNGFAACAAQGRGSAGYEAVYKQAFWNMIPGHNCTNYIAYRMQKAGVNRFVRAGYGNAYQWGPEAVRAGLKVDKGTPRVGDVAWWDRSAIGGTGLGHVAYVESVDVKAGTFTVSEDNYSADFDWRVYRISEVSGFIRVAKPAPTGPPAPSAITGAVPLVAGTLRPGSTLALNAGAWAPTGVRLAYQWMRSGRPIPGATGRTYLVTTVDIAKAITVRVTGTLSGYPTVVQTSRAVGLVTR